MNTIRFSSQAWVIPLMREHKCDILNDGECSISNTIEHALVPLNDFDLTNDDILYLDDVVIQDSEYTIEINKPLNEAVSFVVHKNGETTLRELIWLISRLYKDIYRIEENTASTQRVRLEYKCRSCTDAIAVMNEIEGSDERCSICFEPLTEGVIETKCSHSFHSKCLTEWTRVSKPPSCPMCRARLARCDVCQDSGFIVETRTFIEIPIDLAPVMAVRERLHIENIRVRNTTDGVYGIHTYFLYQLLLSGLQYNRMTRTVSMTITS